MSLRKTSLIAAVLAAALGGPALAQSTTILSVCQDGLQGGASQTHEEMGQFLSGSWQMSATGTGFTLGTNVMSVSLRWDATTETLRMEGGGGPSVTLTPVRYNMNPQGDAPFDMSAETMTPTGLNEDELAVITGCTNPPRYYWQLGAGNQQAWGGLMFVDNDIATGFMANSAGGSRTVVMTR